MSRVYQVCIPHTKRDFFDYEAQPGMEPCVGGRVWVPFRKQIRLGIVLAKNTEEKKFSLKCINALIDSKPILQDDLLALCLWVASYYQSPLSEVIPLALPKKYRLGQDCQLPQIEFYQLAHPLIEVKQSLSVRAKRQLALVEFLGAHTEPVSKEVLKGQGFTSNHLRYLLSLGLLSVSQQSRMPPEIKHTSSPSLTLNSEQADVVKVISQHVHHYQCFLLQGVTGSGKTEVYLQIITQVVLQGKQALVLVPEIGLTPQLLARFRTRFTQPIVVIHSNLNETERQIAWQLAKEGKASIVIGTRAAIFTPMPHLGLIVIDEEHDASLKQMEGVRYSARDTALMRAHWANIPVILGSATPSLESLYNSEQKKYAHLRLPNKALSTIPLYYQLVDLRAQTVQDGFAPVTLHRIKEHLDKQNQVLVFINRRGFAPVLLCHQCGWMTDCSACDSHLTVHKALGQVICHHCGLMQKIPRHCGSCAQNELISVGVGTQRVYEFLNAYFPKTQMLRIDRDVLRKKNSLEEHLKQIQSGAVQLIVGTQMLAKGHHFPKLSLVVILEADAGFYNQDFRATEQLGQLLTQVSGRAGRAEEAGEVLIQTHVPEHPLLNLLIQRGYDDFAEALLTARRQAQLPPFHYLAVIRAQGTTPQRVLSFLQAIKNQLQNSMLTLLGPAPAPLPRKANQYRMQLVLKSASRKRLKISLSQLREWLEVNKLSSGIRWNVDVDPIDLS
jgi:primosomal protein N' (replication factor Y)